MRILLLLLTLTACGADPSAQPVDQTAVATAAKPTTKVEPINEKDQPETGATTASVSQRGEKGDKGDTGAQGERGDKGDKGDHGDEGTDGIQGVAGAKGDTGASGAAGQAGASGADGAAGPKGDAGADGAAGASGPAGPQGPQGIHGDVGSAGATGASGATGSTGATGAQGAQGIAGAAFDHLGVYSDSDERIGDLVDFGVSQEWLVYRASGGGVPAIRFDLDRSVAQGRISSTFSVYFAAANCAGAAYVPASQVIWINVHAVGDSGQAYVVSDKATQQTVNYASVLSSGGACSNTVSSSTSRWYSASLITLPFTYPVAYAYLTEQEG